MAQLPRDEDTPFSLPSDEPEKMPIDYPAMNGGIDQQEVYDEGLENAVDFDPYRSDDNPIKSTNRLMNTGVGGIEHYTTNHDTIRQWMQYRYGHPAQMRNQQNGLQRGGLLIVFEDNEPDIDFVRVSWRRFFKIFDDHQLAFVYKQHKANGDISHFYQFIDRNDVERLTKARRVHD